VRPVSARSVKYGNSTSCVRIPLGIYGVSAHATARLVKTRTADEGRRAWSEKNA
jgi:hypothetical protein